MSRSQWHDGTNDGQPASYQQAPGQQPVPYQQAPGYQQRPSTLNLVLNLLWVPFGIVLALEYVVAGVLSMITIIGIPFGIASFRIANLTVWPFGRDAVPHPGAGAGSLLGNIIWFLLAGWWLALSHLLVALLFFVTIIGIPLGLQAVKLAHLSLAPLGKQIVTT